MTNVRQFQNKILVSSSCHVTTVWYYYGQAAAYMDLRQNRDSKLYPNRNLKSKRNHKI